MHLRGWFSITCLKSIKDNVNDALYDAESDGSDYGTDGIGAEIMKSQSGVASILSTKCFELSEPNFGKIRCTDEGLMAPFLPYLDLQYPLITYVLLK